MAKKTKDELDFEQLCGSFREVLKTPQGKEVIWHILSICDLYSIGGPEGKRMVGIEILTILESVDPTMYARLILHFAKMQEGKNGND